MLYYILTDVTENKNDLSLDLDLEDKDFTRDMMTEDQFF